MRQVLLSLLLSLFSLSVWADGNCIQWADSIYAPQPQANNMVAPDYGLYWVKYDDKTGKEDAVRAYTSSTLAAYLPNGAKNNNPDPLIDNGQAQAKYNSSLPQGYFDPNKPTIIFFHGWQPGNTKAKGRYDMCYQYPLADNKKSPLYNTLKYWKGWNVAVFYWNQFADEPLPNKAEAKIYSTTALEKMRWAFLDKSGNLTHCGGSDSSTHSYQCYIPKATIGTLAYQAVVDAIPSSYHHQLRLAGESLGAQVATVAAHKLLQHQNAPQPSRLVLLDPYFTPGNLGIFKVTVAQHINSLVEDILTQNIPVSEYRTSEVSTAPFGDWDATLMHMVAYTRLYPKYLDNIKKHFALSAAQHRSASYLYFQSMRAAPYWKKDNTADWDRSYLNAKASNADVLSMIGLTRFQQVSPTHLSEFDYEHTEDDVFNIHDD